MAACGIDRLNSPKTHQRNLYWRELVFTSGCFSVADRPGLGNVEFITLIHNHLLDALKVTISQHRPDESEQLLAKLLELLKGWRILDEMQERYVHPIDLSQLSKGPWKVDNQRSHSASPATSAKEKLMIDEANNGGVDGKMVSARLSPVSVNGKE